jgi:hypothetical protein
VIPIVLQHFGMYALLALVDESFLALAIRRAGFGVFLSPRCVAGQDHIPVLPVLLFVRNVLGLPKTLAT